MWVHELVLRRVFLLIFEYGRPRTAKVFVGEEKAGGTQPPRELSSSLVLLLLGLLMFLWDMTARWFLSAGDCSVLCLPGFFLEAHV